MPGWVFFTFLMWLLEYFALCFGLHYRNFIKSSHELITMNKTEKRKVMKRFSTEETNSQLEKMLDLTNNQN